MGGWSGKCPWCGRGFLHGYALKEHKRGAHNVGGHKGGVLDTQDMVHPWEGKLLGAAPWVVSLNWNLAKLPPQWDGPGSQPPSAAVLAAVLTAAVSLPATTPQPRTELDQDGSVTLGWERRGVWLELTFDGQPSGPVATVTPRLPEWKPVRMSSQAAARWIAQELTPPLPRS